VLYLAIPTIGLPGLDAVLPAGNVIAPFEANVTVLLNVTLPVIAAVLLNATFPVTAIVLENTALPVTATVLLNVAAPVTATFAENDALLVTTGVPAAPIMSARFLALLGIVVYPNT
jgi:hypothetical protein